MEYKTQRERIVECLETHESRTSLEAALHLGIMDLPKRISEMVRDGYQIRKTPVPRPHKKPVLHYSIEKED